MYIYIGIDLGTSAVKLLAMDALGKILHTVTKPYPISYPRPGWAEQRPEDWLSQTLAGLDELLKKVDVTSVRGLACSGQMHGLVLLDQNDQVLRPAILWNDGRCEKETAYLNDTIGRSRLIQYTGNVAFAGFTAPKLLWVKSNEPEVFDRIHKVMLPKDYLTYMLTGEFVTDLSDASGTLLLDVTHRAWSKEMLEICGLQMPMLPRLCESYAPVGELKEEYAVSLGLANVLVAAGASDNAAAAIGTGTVGNGACNISLGTSGTVFISSDTCTPDPHYALHAFAHGDGRYHLMGCMLSAAACGKWWVEDILQTDDYRMEEAAVDAKGENPVYFLPYLMGERSPHNDVNARGAFIGLSMATTRQQLTQAVFEGVAFALRDSLEIAKSLGLSIPKTRLCGGGAKSKVWRQILANVLGISVELLQSEEGPALGAAILAAVASGQYHTVQEATRQLVQVKSTVSPDPKAVLLYEKRYQTFHSLYPVLKTTFSEISKP